VDKEYQYDMSRAKYYSLEAASIISAIDSYGIYYADWQTGAVSDSEKFPCCE